MIDLNKYKFLVFDCDGVIINSNEIKSKCFYEVALTYGEENARQLLQYHKENQGISRFVKFRYLFETILNKNLPKDDYDFCLSEYAKQIAEKIPQSEFTSGIQEFLASCKQNLFVISGTPESELQQILKDKKIDDHFKLILGSPCNKYENLEKVFKNFPHKPSEGLFFGDAKVDFESSQTFGMDFCFVSDYTEMTNYSHYFQDKKVTIIKNFTELLNSTSKN